MLTYAEAAQKFAARRRNVDHARIDYHTVLTKNGEDYQVVLYGTPVITIKPNGTYQIKTGGWDTLLTKARIKEYSPAEVVTVGGELYFRYNGGEAWRFTEGAIVTCKGVPVEALKQAA